MKSLKLFLIALMATAFVSSCNKDNKCTSGEGSTVSRNFSTDSFNTVAVFGDAEVYLTKDSVRSVRIEGQSSILDALKVQVYGSDLAIGEDNCFKNYRTLKVYIATPDLRGVEINGAVDVYSSDTFSASSFYADQAGSGTMALNIDVQQFTSSISGSGTITMNGMAKDQNLKISGSGNYRCFGLVGENGDVNISGSGDVEINVSQTLKVKVSGSGDIHYKGTPTIDQDISGSGKMVHVQ